MGERLDYVLYYKGIPAASAHLALQRADSASALITFRTRTRTLWSTLFRINNVYRTWIEIKSGEPLRSEKDVEQKNIRQRLEVDYDRDSHTVRCADKWEFSLPAGCLDMLALIHRLRIEPTEPGDELNLWLHIEGQLWRARGRCTALEQERRKTSFSFEWGGGLKHRDWKTDLLTNRLVREGSVLEIVSGSGNRPVRISFGDEVEMRLRDRED